MKISASVLLLFASSICLFASFIGAPGLLRKVADAIQPVVAAGDSEAKILGSLEEYKKVQSSLSAEQAAKDWTALVTRRYALPNRYDMFSRLEFDTFVQALPTPASWPFLLSGLDDKKEAAKSQRLQAAILRWYVYRLEGDVKGLLQDYNFIQDQLGSSQISYVLNGLTSSTLDVIDDGSIVLDILQKRLATIQASASGGNLHASHFGQMEVPDIVSLLGREKASEFLRKALTSAPVVLGVRESVATQKLAAEIALEDVAQLKAPQWALTQSLDGGPLYQALLSKFSESDKNDYAFKSARQYELLRLLIENKTAEAVALAQTIGTDALPYSALAAAEQSGRLESLNGFLHEILTENPKLPLWDFYVSVAARSGNSAQMLELLTKALSSKDLDNQRRESLEQSYAQALLAADQVNEGVKELIKIASRPPAKSKARFTGHHRNEPPGIQIAHIGLLMSKPGWVDEGISLSKKSLSVMSSQGGKDTEYPALAKSLAELLMDLDRGPEAEQVLADALIFLKKNKAAMADSFSGCSAPDILATLVGLYASSGRSADVLALVQDSPDWEAADLAKIIALPCYLGHRRSQSLGGCVAEALFSTGRQEEARRILLATLKSQSGQDPLYALLLKMENQEAALATLDELAEREQFEERPLIWKAQLLYSAGNLEDSEKVARAAIKVDPSDGEQGAGDRMRVYGILANILQAKGDTQNAEVFRGVIKSIRLSEKADTFYAQGLVSRAVVLYKESLDYFSDAYCIQSRLALRLSEQGRWKEAEEHYRRAYELMPGSFGRVESHCFGCERAFAGSRQQTIAERVFTGLAEQQPNNPQVHYLLGYLRYEQERYAEALPEFEKAVALDADYLNAWKKIVGMQERMRLPESVRNAAALNMARLDPLQKHGNLTLSGATNLADVWSVLAKASTEAGIPGNLFPLPAAAAALKGDEENTKDSRANWMRRQREMIANVGKPKTPGQIFAQQEFTRNTEQLLQSSVR